MSSAFGDTGKSLTHSARKVEFLPLGEFRLFVVEIVAHPQKRRRAASGRCPRGSPWCHRLLGVSISFVPFFVVSVIKVFASKSRTS